MIHFATRVLTFLTIAMLFDAGVRANAPAGHYTVSGTGAAATVLDTKSKLTWQQTLSSTSAGTWANATTYCAGVGATLGGTGWRLPTVKELLTLVDFSQAAAPRVDLTAFPGTPAAAVFWTSTLSPGGETDAWIVFFRDGHSDTLYVGNTALARCVR